MEEEHDISEEEAAIEIEEAEMDIEEAEMDFEQGTQTETDDDQKPDTEDNVLECGEELKKDDLNEDEALAALAGLANEEDFKVPQGDNSTWQADRLGEITVTGNGKSFSEYCVRHDGSKLRVGDFYYIIPQGRAKELVSLYIGAIEAIYIYNGTDEIQERKEDIQNPQESDKIWLSVRWYYRPIDIFKFGNVPESLSDDVVSNEIFKTDVVNQEKLENFGCKCLAISGKEFDALPTEEQAAYHGKKWSTTLSPSSIYVYRRYYNKSDQALVLMELSRREDSDEDQKENGTEHALKQHKPVIIIKEFVKSTPRREHHPAPKYSFKAAELANSLIKFEEKIPLERITTNWIERRKDWLENAKAATAIRDLCRCLLDLEQGIGIIEYRRTSDLSNIHTWRHRVANLHTYSSVEYQIKAYASEVAASCNIQMTDLGMQPFKRGGRKSSTVRAGEKTPNRFVGETANENHSLDIETNPSLMKYLGIMRTGGRPRWSMDRYIRGQRFLVTVLRKFEADSQKDALPRPLLRDEARKSVGDTGLLDHLLKHMIDLPFEGYIMRRYEGPGGLFGYWLEKCSSQDTKLPQMLFSRSVEGKKREKKDSPQSKYPSVPRKKEEKTKERLNPEHLDNGKSHFNLRPSRQLHKLKHRYADDDEMEIPQIKKRKRHDKLLKSKVGFTKDLERQFIGTPKIATSQQQTADNILSSMAKFRDEGAAQLSKIRCDMDTFRAAFVDMATAMKDIRAELKESNSILHSLIERRGLANGKEH